MGSCLYWMEGEFFEIDRVDGNLSRLSMDAALRDRGVEDPDLRRMLRRIWRLMQQEYREQAKADASDRH